MKITKKKINNIDMVFIDTNKFKSICAALFFKMPVKEDLMVKRNLIKQILIHTCKKYPKNRLLNINCLENYDAYYSANFRRDGNYVTNSFLFRSLDERYTDKDNLKRVIDTFTEIIFNPNADGKKFDEEEYNLAYQTLKTRIESKIERANEYAIDKLFKQMGESTPVSYIMSLDILNNITNEELYKEYLNMINNSEVFFVVAGNNVSKLDYSKILGRVKSTTYDKDVIIETEIPNKINSKKEDYNGMQSVLTVGLKHIGLTKFERQYVLPIYNNILGGGASSRLFDIIREKNSLCYSCFSRSEKDDSIIDIFAGIENENYDKTLSLIKEVIESMKNITEEELNRSKMDIKSSIEEGLDDLFSYIMPFYLSNLYSEDNLLDKLKNFNKVTKNDVEVLHKKIHITDSFFLKGGKTNG